MEASRKRIEGADCRSNPRHFYSVKIQIWTSDVQKITRVYFNNSTDVLLYRAGVFFRVPLLQFGGYVHE